MSKMSGRVSALSGWDRLDGHTVQLTQNQNQILQQMNGQVDNKRILKQNCLPSMATGLQSGAVSSLKDTSNDLSSRGQDTDPTHHHLNSAKHFMEWIYKVEAQLDKKQDHSIKDCSQNLQKALDDIHKLLAKVDVAVATVDTLSDQHAFVSDKSNSLHTACQSLMAEQEKLSRYSEEVSHRLVYYKEVDGMIEKLGLPSFSIHSEFFAETLNKIDACVTFLERKPNYVNSNTYIVRYKAALARALGMIKDYVRNSFAHAAGAASSETLLTSDDTFGMLYGKFKAQVPKVENAISLLECRVPEDAKDVKNQTLYQEYHSAIQDCHGVYFNCRAQLLVPSVRATVAKLCAENKHNHCGLMRSGCSLLLHVAEDEHRLFKQFFKKKSDLFRAFLDGICVIFYDTMRPLIVNLQHLETLSELTSILRTEMLDYHCANHPDHLEAFEQIVGQLLQDAQERLIFRTHIYIRTDIADYSPHPGDLSYPEKLEMMESIQESLREASEGRRNSVSSTASMSSMEVANINNKINSSPVDMHGMWYPTVRRTLVCLSRLYRCLELEIFQGLSQEVLTACTASLQHACQLITERKGQVNGQLFLIKHLLILREQMTPFQVQMAVTETSLDFTKLRSAALNLITHRGANLMKGDAILKFLLEGTVPEVKEHCIDSRREIDQRLKQSCEVFIAKSVDIMVGPMKSLFEKIKNVQGSPAKKVHLAKLPFSSPDAVRDVASECQKSIKKNFPSIQRSLHLYLSNKETEFILFRPIRNEVMTTYLSLLQIINNEYSSDDQVIIAFPSQEQIAMLLASLQIQTSHSSSSVVNGSSKNSQPKQLQQANE